MKGKTVGIVIGVLVLLLVITGVVVYKAVFSQKPAPPQTTEDITSKQLLPVDASINVDVVKSAQTANAVVIRAKGMAGKMTSLAYELTYESKGLIKGVNSGSKPIDVTGKDVLDREIYLGTCSRNVCTPDVGVTKVTLVLEFTDTSGNKSQFSKDYML